LRGLSGQKSLLLRFSKYAIKNQELGLYGLNQLISRRWGSNIVVIVDDNQMKTRVEQVERNDRNRSYRGILSLIRDTKEIRIAII
jgi:hypothetical protein